ncbi:MAG TPA: peptidoglycan recognition family protein [Paludibaculum sp.]
MASLTPIQGKAPNPVIRAVVGWQANRIPDPVARLHFLRRTVGDLSTWNPASAAGRSHLRSHPGRLAAVLGALLLLPAGAITGSGFLWNRHPIVNATVGTAEAISASSVWAVEQNKDFETYSNGLRIERRYETGNETRSYDVYPRGFEDSGRSEARTLPAGIVFHTTESPQAEFTEDQTRRIRLIGAALLDYVRSERAYHYVVDRFGRVWRIVRETDSANHAGYSVWADAEWTYISLNRAFLGISVEALTQTGTDRSEATPAQLTALRTLTEMLRAKYRIPVTNCATHAQVSVNPDNMLAGYHYDWAANFPYAGIGLPNNYSLPTPSLWLFGFTYDTSLVRVTGEQFWKGLALGEEQLRQNATAHGMSVPQYREALFKRYRKVLSTFKAKTEKSKENIG